MSACGKYAASPLYRGELTRALEPSGGVVQLRTDGTEEQLTPWLVEGAAEASPFLAGVHGALHADRPPAYYKVTRHNECPYENSYASDES